jgi:hypothetical protein
VKASREYSHPKFTVLSLLSLPGSYSFQPLLRRAYWRVGLAYWRRGLIGEGAYWRRGLIVEGSYWRRGLIGEGAY